jgi:hypothetical protein
MSKIWGSRPCFQDPDQKDRAFAAILARCNEISRELAERCGAADLSRSGATEEGRLRPSNLILTAERKGRRADRLPGAEAHSSGCDDLLRDRPDPRRLVR